MLSTDSGFSRNVDRAAALERLSEARRLLDTEPPAYTSSAYVAGGAVECILHAYRMQAGKPDDAKHNVNDLAQRNGFFDGMTSEQEEMVSAYLGEVFVRWQNNHRHRNEGALRDDVTRHRLFAVSGSRTTQQDALAFNAEQLYNAAEQIVTAGVI